MTENDKTLLAQFHQTISQQLNSRLSESPQFFGLLVVVSTAYGYVMKNVGDMPKLFIPTTLLAFCATLWASWYLAALGYGFRFLQNCQHCIEHELGWTKYSPGQGMNKETGKPPKSIRKPSEIFWLLPSIYHPHAAGLFAFLAIICVASCLTSWTWYPHCYIVICGLFALSLGIVCMVWANAHYVRRFRSKWQDPAKRDPKNEVGVTAHHIS